jgi:hypothetical protein
MGFISGIFTSRQSNVDGNNWTVPVRRMSLDSMDDPENSEVRPAPSERFVSDAEIQTLKYCFTLAPNTGDKRILGKIENGDLCLRPASIQAFKVILAEKGLMDNPVIAGLLRWIETDSKRYFRFRL